MYQLGKRFSAVGVKGLSKRCDRRFESYLGHCRDSMDIVGRTLVKHAPDEPIVLELEPKVQRMVHVTKSNARDCYL
jgi:hypothetical protein